MAQKTEVAWEFVKGWHILRVPQGTAFLSYWANPSYIHGLVFVPGEPVFLVPPTDRFASQKHMKELPEAVYATAEDAAKAFCEWKLRLHEPWPEASSCWHRLMEEELCRIGPRIFPT